MRRKEREMPDPDTIDRIIRSCDCCRLGLADREGPYIVPLNFGYLHEGDTRIFYFHSAREGRKIDLIRQNRAAGFELDTGHRLQAGQNACGYTYGFASVVGTGTVSIVESGPEKLRALRLLMEHYTQKSDWEFDEKAVSAVAILKLTVGSLCCKVHE